MQEMVVEVGELVPLDVMDILAPARVDKAEPGIMEQHTQEVVEEVMVLQIIPLLVVEQAAVERVQQRTELQELSNQAVPQQQELLTLVEVEEQVLPVELKAVKMEDQV